jgi:hypothetical protein
MLSRHRMLSCLDVLEPNIIDRNKTTVFHYDSLVDNAMDFGSRGSLLPFSLLIPGVVIFYPQSRHPSAFYCDVWPVICVLGS